MPDESDDNTGVHLEILDTLDILTTNLEEFFKENSDLFTLIGVFGAVALYLSDSPTQIDSSTLIENFVLVTGMTISVMVGFIILIKSVKRVVESDAGFISLENILFFPFWALFYMLFGTIASYLATFSRIWRMYLILVTIIVPLILFVIFIESLSDLVSWLSIKVPMGEKALFAIILFLIFVLSGHIGLFALSQGNISRNIIENGATFTTYAHLSILIAIFIWGTLSLPMSILTTTGLVISHLYRISTAIKSNLKSYLSGD